MTFKHNTSTSDFNTMVEEGIYAKWASVSNSPISGTHLWIICVFRYTQEDSFGLTQIAFASAEGRAFIRGIDVDGIVWKP